MKTMNSAQKNILCIYFAKMTKFLSKIGKSHNFSL